MCNSGLLPSPTNPQARGTVTLCHKMTKAERMMSDPCSITFGSVLKTAASDRSRMQIIQPNAFPSNWDTRNRLVYQDYGLALEYNATRLEVVLH